MKKHLLLFIIVTISLSESKAQYYPMLGDTTQWCLAWNFIAVRSASGTRMLENNTYTAMTDTIYDTLTYKKVFSDYAGYFGAMREDTAAKKVYFIKSGDTVEHLIYDFSLNLGNTFLVDLNNNLANNLNDGLYTVDSVATVNIRGGSRKYIRLHNPSNINLGWDGKPLKLEWIESVGDIYNPMYTYAYDDFGYGWLQSYCNNTHESAVMKQTINSTKNYLDLCTATYVGGDIDADTCDILYWSDIDELAYQTQIAIYPNPSNGCSITIDVNNYILKNNCGVKISDATGKIVYSKNAGTIGNSIKLDNLNLLNGIYFLSLSDDKVVFTKAKLVVEK